MKTTRSGSRHVALFLGLAFCACASGPRAGDAPDTPILTPSGRTSPWPVEGEAAPGIWFRLESSFGAPAAEELVEDVRIVVEHGHRQQVITGPDFSASSDVGGMYETAYLYTPTSGVLFVTIALRARGRGLFPDTQRIELKDDCWHMLSYRVRGPIRDDHPYPPPYPRTAFLSPALSSDPPLYLDVFLSGNCFRNPLPPH